jgi:hypothetical protein
LIPGNEYDLAFFGQTHNGSQINPAVFKVDGYGQITTADVAQFLDVIASVDGKITGQMERTGNHSTWSGLQIQGSFVAADEVVVPEVASLTAWLFVSLAVIAGGWCMRRRGKCELEAR